ncbi:MAG: hypothetical protein MUC88_27670 [Planctomycetes bacterium]|nr:hypothetical protein [Planctomycetota bacterium]
MKDVHMNQVSMPKYRVILWFALTGIVLAWELGPHVASAQAQSYAPPLLWDFTKDCCVDLRDLAVLAERWLQVDDVTNLADPYRIDVLDLALFAQQWHAPVAAPGNEGTDWQILHPEWIFCDDFEDKTPLRRQGRYFEHDNDGGDFVVVDGVGLNGSRGLRARYQAKEVSAGALHLAFGRVPSSYFDMGIRSGEDFRDIYYRVYMRNQAGWQGSPAKLSRATVFAGSNWSHAMIAHLWSSGNVLVIDPASGVDSSGKVVTTKYNDFENLRWLGLKRGVTPIFAPPNANRWFCIEAHVRLNDPGQSNGVQEFWIDGKLEARRTDLNFVGTYTDYGINAVFLENYWNAGSTKLQERYFDSFVVSTQPIGCLCAIDPNSSPGPTP